MPNEGFSSEHELLTTPFPPCLCLPGQTMGAAQLLLVLPGIWGLDLTAKMMPKALNLLAPKCQILSLGLETPLIEQLGIQVFLSWALLPNPGTSSLLCEAFVDVSTCGGVWNP